MDYTIFDGYLVYKRDGHYVITDECQFVEYYDTYQECIDRILELN